MTDLRQTIMERRSIRKYEEKDLPDPMLQRILEAVQWAPSWANTQVWEVIVVRDTAIKEKLQQTMAPKNPATKAIVLAPVVLTLCAKTKSSGYYDGQVTTKFGDWFMFDLGLATQNICLTAHDLGLGTVIVGLFDHDKAAALLNVPDGYECVAMIPVGFPAKTGVAPKRREISEFTHYDSF
jgi:nitroreductase